MNAKLHAAIMEKVIPKYVRIAPDHELVAYWRTQLDKARELRAIDPKYCAQFLTPQPGVDTSGLAGLFSQKVQDKDIQALANLIRAGADHPGRVPPGSEVEGRAARQRSSRGRADARCRRHRCQSADCLHTAARVLRCRGRLLRVHPRPAPRSGGPVTEVPGRARLKGSVQMFCPECGAPAADTNKFAPRAAGCLLPKARRLRSRSGRWRGSGPARSPSPSMGSPSC